MNTPPTAAHIVLRIQPTISIRGHKVDVIAEHNRVFEQQGRVAVGKFGASWTPSKCDAFTSAIAHGKTLYLFLVSKKAPGYQAFRAPIRAVFLAGQEKRNGLHHPPYYDLIAQQPHLQDEFLEPHPSMWFELGGPLKPHTIDNLRLLTSGRALLEVLDDCRTCMMLVVSRMHHTPSAAR